MSRIICFDRQVRDIELAPLQQLFFLSFYMEVGKKRVLHYRHQRVCSVAAALEHNTEVSQKGDDDDWSNLRKSCGDWLNL